MVAAVGVGEEADLRRRHTGREQVVGRPQRGRRQEAGAGRGPAEGGLVPPAAAGRIGVGDMAPRHVVDEHCLGGAARGRHGQRRGVHEVVPPGRAGQAPVPRGDEEPARKGRRADGRRQRRQRVGAGRRPAGPQGGFGGVRAECPQAGGEATDVGPDATRWTAPQLLGDEEHLHRSAPAWR